MGTLTADDVRGMDQAEILQQLAQMRDIDLLNLPDSVVLALPVDVLHARRDRLLASRYPLNGTKFARIAGCTTNHFGRLRSAYITNGGVESHNALPAPDPDLSDEDMKQPLRPGEKPTRGRASGTPRWALGDALRWLTQYERAHPDTLILRPGGRKPPGRTPADLAAAT